MQNRSQKVKCLSQLALLTAITLVMAFTPLGYLRTPVLSVSFLTVPVAIGAILLGPGAGALLGLVFGLTSFADAFTGGGMKAILLSINPFGCLVTTVVARVLCGWLCGLAYRFWHKVLKAKFTAYYLGAMVCPLMNTVFFMGFILLFYYNSDYVQSLCQHYRVTNPISLMVAMVGVQGLVELAVCTFLAGGISNAVGRYFKR